MKKIVSVIMSALICFGLIGVAGCIDKEETPQNAPTVETPSKIGKVNPFDTQKQLSSVQMFGYLGKAELNKDAAYIKEGEGSMKVTVESDPIANESPFFYQGLDQTPISRANFTNFDYVSHVAMEVYNAQEETSRIGLRLIYKYDSWGDTKQSIITWFDLTPGWNAVEYVPGREYITLNGDGIRFVESIALVFERGEEDTVYYLDDLRQYQTNIAPSTIIKQLAENEICSFDHKWQSMSLGNLYWVDAKMQPIVEFNLDPKYTATGSGGSLKLTFPADSKDDISWPGIIIPSTSLETIDFSVYDDNDVLCIDAYTPEGKSADSFTLLLLGPNTSTYFQQSQRLKAGAWTNFRITVGEIRKKDTNSRVDFEDTDAIEITVSGRTREQVLYLDNIRMEVVD